MRFARSDRRGLITALMVLLAAAAGFFADRWFLHPLPHPVALNEAAMDSLETAWSGVEGAPAAAAPSAQPGGGTYAVPVLPPETFPFDPNTADSTALLRLGLAPWQVRSIYRYRARGGRYHQPEDFKRLYGMTPELWERLAPVIRIDRKYRYFTEDELAPSAPRPAADSARTDEADRPQQQPRKFTELTLVDLNTADTTLLQQIPGIASYRARQIIRYRDRLGGFVSTEQLAEVEGLPTELHAWFKVETPVRRKLNLNTATLAELGRHPYMGFPRARAIVNHRRVHGPIRDLAELRLLPDFTEEAIQRLLPYVEY